MTLNPSQPMNFNERLSELNLPPDKFHVLEDILRKGEILVSMDKKAEVEMNQICGGEMKEAEKMTIELKLVGFFPPSTTLYQAMNQCQPIV